MNRHLRVARLAAASLAAAGLLAACGTSGNSSTGSTSSGSSGNGGGSTAASTTIGTMNTSLGTVLTGAKGLTLYMFKPDTATSSMCNSAGSCSSLWPPAAGTGALKSGTTLPGKLGTIMRQDGSTQVTYQNHPLYTYAKDSAPGQTNGQGVLNMWSVVTPTTAALPSTGGAAPAPATTAPATGGGVGSY
jgi:predicted lipoprotein with Yx(FWY)xxD motif